MQTIVYQCDTAMPAQKLPNCCFRYIRIIAITTILIKTTNGINCISEIK